MALSWCDGFLAIRRNSYTHKNRRKNRWKNKALHSRLANGVVLITHNIYLSICFILSFSELLLLLLLWRLFDSHFIHHRGTPQSDLAGADVCVCSRRHTNHSHFTQLHNFHWSICLPWLALTLFLSFSWFHGDLKPTHNIWLL